MADTKLSGAAWCSAINCTNNSHQSKKRSFFRFPKDPARCKKWVVACRRTDLDDKSPQYLYTNCRICSDHFEPLMFLNYLKNRLHSHAVPSIFNVKNPPPLVQSTRRVLKRKADLQVQQMIEHNSNKKMKADTILASEGTGNEVLSTEVAAEILLGLSNGLSVPMPSTSGAASIIDDSVCEQKKENTDSSAATFSPRKNLRRLASKWRSRASRWAKRAHRDNAKEVPNDVHCECCTSNLSPQLQSFLKLFRKPRVGRYSQDLKSFALSLFFISIQAYMLLSQHIPLPSKRLLQSIVSKVQVSPGLGDWMIQILRLTSNTLTELERNCVLCIDEMSIKSNLSYDSGKDRVTGFVCFGDSHTFTDTANSSLVFLIRGISSNWKQPISYYFSSNSCPAEQLELILFSVIEQLKEIGFTVKVVVSDMGSNFLHLFNRLNISLEHPYFFVKNIKVWYLFDPPHLIKSIRNNHLLNTFKFDGKQASWADIKLMYSNDKKLTHRLVPKLFDSHIFLNNFSKMKVKLATQLISHSSAAAINANVSMGLLPASAVGTSELIERFDKLFDCFNSSSLYSANKYKSAFSSTSCHKEFLMETLSFLGKIQVHNSAGKNVTNSIKCLFGWKLAIHTLLSLSTQLLNTCNFSFLLTRRLNQDALENYFCNVRQQGGNCDHPTPSQCVTAFKQLSLKNHLNVLQSGNCTLDEDKCILNICDLTSHVMKKSKPCANGEKLIINMQDYRYLAIPEQNGLVYIAGYILSKCLQKHTCEICAALNGGERSLASSSADLFCYFKAYENGHSDFSGLKIPCDPFVTFISVLSHIFKMNFPTLRNHDGVGSKLLSKCMHVEFLHPCLDFPKVFAMKLFLRMMICHTLKRTNKDRLTMTGLKKQARQNKKLNKIKNLFVVISNVEV